SLVPEFAVEAVDHLVVDAQDAIAAVSVIGGIVEHPGEINRIAVLLLVLVVPVHVELAAGTGKPVPLVFPAANRAKVKRLQLDVPAGAVEDDHLAGIGHRDARSTETGKEA